MPEQAGNPISRHIMALNADRCIGTVTGEAIGVEAGMQIMGRLPRPVKGVARGAAVGIGFFNRF